MSSSIIRRKEDQVSDVEKEGVLARKMGMLGLNWSNSTRVEILEEFGRCWPLDTDKIRHLGIASIPQM